MRVVLTPLRPAAGVLAIVAGVINCALAATPVTPMAAWKMAKFTPQELANGTSDDGATPAGDGIPNLIKYALNLEPHADGRAGLPTIALTDDHLTISYTRVPAASDLGYLAEVSGGLQAWLSGAFDVQEVDAVDQGNGTQSVIARDLSLAGVSGQRFIRLRPVRTNPNTDGDSLPDDWELKYFANLTPTDNADPDQDGVSNEQECFNQTNPTNFTNATVPLVPMSLVFSSYLGGTLVEQSRDVAVDAQGNFYVVGGTESATFPGITTTIVNGGAKETSEVFNLDIFVLKFGPAGNLLWGTRIGGPNYDRAYAVEVDSAGYVYVGGRVGFGFPVTAGAAQTTHQGGSEAGFYGSQDGGVVKLTPDGTQIVWSTFFGATDGWIVRDVDLDASGNVCVVSGHTLNSPYTTGVQAAFAGTFQPNVAGTKDTVVAKIAANGSQVLWATHLGGSADESQAPALRVDRNTGAVYVLTTTQSTNMPTTVTSYDRTYNGGQDLYVAKLNSAGTQLLFGTYLGGSSTEGHETHQIALDRQGNVYLTTGTQSTNYPTTVGAFQRTLKGGSDFALSKLSADGSTLMASTLIGGSLGEFPQGISVNARGEAIFTGSTGSTDFPVTTNALQTTRKGTGDGVIAHFSADMQTLRFSTYLGGVGGGNELRASAIDANGNIYAVGQTSSTSFPLQNPLQGNYGGSTSDGTVVKISPVVP